MTGGNRSPGIQTRSGTRMRDEAEMDDRYRDALDCLISIVATLQMQIEVILAGGIPNRRHTEAVFMQLEAVRELLEDVDA